MTNTYILSLITWLPAVGAILILALMKKDQSSLIKKFATAWFAFDFVISLWLLKYNRSAGGMQFLQDHEWIPIIGARYQMGVDDVAWCHSRSIVLELHSETREGILRLTFVAADCSDWCLCIDGLVLVLPVLRSFTGPDVFPY